MATLVTFHAHPDDESISTGGTMTLAARAGHRVIIVTATDGAVGEVEDDFLDDGETLAECRSRELDAAAEVMGVARVVRLGYRDSGMIDTDDNEHPDSFWQADVEAAAARLAAVLREENADVLTVYDDHGGYGHPDHIQVHRVGHRAAELAGTPRVYEATMNRDRIKEMADQAREAGATDGPASEEADDARLEEIGLPDAEITAAVDVSSVIDTKEAAMRAHASQIGPDSWFLTLPEGAFTTYFGREWFRRTQPPVVAGDPREESVFG